MANHASTVVPFVPSWAIRAVITTIVGLFLTGFVTWGAHLSDADAKHETRISVLEDHIKGEDKSLEELKQGQRDMDEKLDRILRKL
jgi:hypothetical protein